MINNSETIFFTVTFLLPGFIIFYIKSMLVPQRIVSSSDSIFRYFFYSSINMLVSVPLLYFVESSNYYKDNPYIVIFGWIVIVIILPIVLGIGFANISSRGIDKKILNKMCPSTLDAIPTAWDYKFSKLDEARYIVVKLKDGTTLRGLYSENSYASSQIEERDIYLEELFDIDEDKNWIEINNSDGVLLKATEIVAIEFRKITNNQNQENDTLERQERIIGILTSIENEIKEMNENTISEGA